MEHVLDTLRSRYIDLEETIERNRTILRRDTEAMNERIDRVNSDLAAKAEIMLALQQLFPEHFDADGLPIPGAIFPVRVVDPTDDLVSDLPVQRQTLPDRHA